MLDIIKICLPCKEPSLNEGLGAIPDSRKPLAGTRPSEDSLIHIVPPVITMRTLDSEGCDAISTTFATTTVESA